MHHANMHSKYYSKISIRLFTKSSPKQPLPNLPWYPLVPSHIQCILPLSFLGTLGNEMSHLITVVTCSCGYRAISSFMLFPAFGTLYTGPLVSWLWWPPFWTTGFEVSFFSAEKTRPCHYRTHFNFMIMPTPRASAAFQFLTSILRGVPFPFVRILVIAVISILITEGLK